MLDLLNSPVFPLEELSTQTYVKLPKHPHAESKSVKLYIILAEPHLFLEGFEKAEYQSRPPAILRGCLFLRILHPVKIKDITLKFKGTSRTEWPEGIPPRKVENIEEKGLINHTWPFYNHLNHYPTLPNSRNNADIYIPKPNSDVSNFSLDASLSPVTSFTDIKPIKSPTSILKSFRSPTSSLSLTDIKSSKSNSALDEKVFHPGDYVYSFELPIQSSLPETVNATFGSISYFLEAHVERRGAFKTSLTARRPVSIIRIPFESSSEENEPIIIDRDWENKLQYDIAIYSKQVILNSYLPISFRMIPLDKLKVHRIRVYITEHLEYYCHNKKVHRTEPPKKILLLEHKPVKPNDNLLSLGDDEIGGVELDFQVFIPEYYTDRLKLHHDTSSEDIQAHHWIKICIRISKSEPTPEDPDKRKQYELSIDSPLHILSPHCVHANTLLPSYDEQIRLDCTNSDNTSNKTLTPRAAATTTPIHPPQTRQSIDKMMTPREDTILDSNLFKPDDSTPIELLSTQAKPFSPIASPQLNAINPELRDSPIIRPLDLSPVSSPVPRQSRSKTSSSARSRTMSPMSRSNSALPHLMMARMSSQSSLHDEPPPPPFVENPPSYEEAVKKSSQTATATTTTTSTSLSVATSVSTASKPRTDRTNSSSSHSLNSNNSGSSGISFKVKRVSQSKSSTSSSQIPEGRQGSNSTTNSTSVSNPSVNQHKNINTDMGTTRISLNLSSTKLPQTLSRLGSTMNMNNSSSSMTPTETETPSISSQLQSPQDEADVRGGTTQERNKQIRGRIMRNTPSFDLAQDTDLKFKITPIRSPSVSPAPYNRSSSSSSSLSSPSHVRSASPAPMVANDRNLNKLVKCSFTPGFSIQPSTSSPLINSISTSAPDSQLPNISITNSNSDGTDETNRIIDPLLEGNASDVSSTEDITENAHPHSILSDSYHLHSNTLGSLNTLDIIPTSGDERLLKNSLSGPSSSTADVSRPFFNETALNYLGNNTGTTFLTNFEDTDITSMDKR